MRRRLGKLRCEQKATPDETSCAEHKPRWHAVVVEDRGGRGMARNRRLARAVSDAALGGFILGPDAKCRERGVPLKRCLRCGAVKEAMPPDERTCRSVCGCTADRDVNAARNLAQAYIAVSSTVAHD